MADEKGVGKRRKRRLLIPAEKYEVWLEVVTGQGTQREIADRWGVDRSTVTSIVKTAKQGALDRLAASRPGRAGKTPEVVALEDARAEIARLRETITEQAVEVASPSGKRVLGLMAGPVPARVDASVKAGLLALVDHATEGGWSQRRACRVLELNPDRVGRWRRRRRVGEGLVDTRSGPTSRTYRLPSKQETRQDLKWLGFSHRSPSLTQKRLT